ncbi:MAG: Xylose isomerase-like TIM barrel [Candidatus Hinthialibacteria bacterium OLB16]|nr:MAG: Xylose isomerase-like TIM barrel [Candidatus Hinthialibacteria bacterium OLB16]
MDTGRRGILKAAGLALLTGGLNCSSTQAMEPVSRNPGKRIKLSIAAYSFRNELKAEPPQMTLHEGFIDIAVREGLDAIEPTSYYFPEPVTPEYILRLKQRAFLEGLDISGTAIGNTFTYPPGPDRDKQLELTRTWVDHAALLGAPCIRVFAGRIQPGDDIEKARAYCIETLEVACDYAGTKGVYLALENHGGIVDTADNMLPIVRAVKSPWFGVNLDGGNFTSEDPYKDLAIMAPYAVNVQVKAQINPGGKGKVPADLKKVMSIIKDSGYRGYVALEYEADEPALVGVPKYLAQLRELVD